MFCLKKFAATVFLFAALALLGGGFANAANPQSESASTQKAPGQTQTNKTTAAPAVNAVAPPAVSNASPSACPAGQCSHGVKTSTGCTYWCSTACPSTACN